MSGSGRIGGAGPAERGRAGEAPLVAGRPPRDLLDGVDDLLDEIDEVLEENAEEFVRGYVQKGGQ
ncbi:MAG: ubiquitin-like protein Pup [Nitriliruptoraceae bacterium]